jgi:hypothetical protein
LRAASSATSAHSAAAAASGHQKGLLPISAASKFPRSIASPLDQFHKIGAQHDAVAQHLAGDAAGGDAGGGFAGGGSPPAARIAQAVFRIIGNVRMARRYFAAMSE